VGLIQVSSLVISPYCFPFVFVFFFNLIRCEKRNGRVSGLDTFDVGNKN
jgi:hypothetical protein